MAVSLGEEEIRVGQEASFLVRVEWPGRGDRYRDCRLEPPKLVNGRMVGNEVETRVRLEGGRPRTEWLSTFRFLPEAEGAGRIGPVEFAFREEASSVEGGAPTTAPPSFLGAAALDFHVRPGDLLPLRLGAEELVAAGACVILLFVGAFGLGRSRGRRDRLRAVAVARQAAREGEAARGPFSDEELQRCRVEGEGRAFYALLREELVDALCRGLAVEREKAWGDDELCAALERAGMAEAESRALRSFLDECTRVRFGGERPAGQSMEEAMRRARRLVEAAGPSDGGRT